MARAEARAEAQEARGKARAEAEEARAQARAGAGESRAEARAEARTEAERRQMQASKPHEGCGSAGFSTFSLRESARNSVPQFFPASVCATFLYWSEGGEKRASRTGYFSSKVRM